MNHSATSPPPPRSSSPPLRPPPTPLPPQPPPSLPRSCIILSPTRPLFLVPNEFGPPHPSSQRYVCPLPVKSQLCFLDPSSPRQSHRHIFFASTSACPLRSALGGGGVRSHLRVRRVSVYIFNDRAHPELHALAPLLSRPFK